VDTWRSMKKMWGHILVHSRAKKLAMLSNKEWRKNHTMLWSNHDHPTSTHMHTLIWVYDIFSMDPLSDLAIYVIQVRFTLILPWSLLEVGKKAKHQYLGEDIYTIEWFETTIWEVSAKFSIAKVIKTPSMLHRG